jgi:hypothetical protein
MVAVHLPALQTLLARLTQQHTLHHCDAYSMSMCAEIVESLEKNEHESFHSMISELYW